MVHIPLKEIATKFLLIQFDPDQNHNFAESEYYSSGEGSSFATHYIAYAISKLGGIFQDRDLCFMVRFYQLSEDSIVYVQEQSDAIPSSNKYIRSTFYLSGGSFKALSPTSTLITYIVQMDPGGSIPKCKPNIVFLTNKRALLLTLIWIGLINASSGFMYDTQTKLKHVLESNSYTKIPPQLKSLPQL